MIPVEEENDESKERKSGSEEQRYIQTLQSTLNVVCGLNRKNDMIEKYRKCMHIQYKGTLGRARQ